MSTTAETLLRLFRTTPDLSHRINILRELAMLIPDSDAFECILETASKVSEDSDDTLPLTLEALEILGWCDFPQRNAATRVVNCLQHCITSSTSEDVKIVAIEAIGRFLENQEVEKLLSMILRNPSSTKALRSTSLVVLTRLRDSDKIRSLLTEMLADKELGSIAHTLLKQLDSSNAK